MSIEHIFNRESPPTRPDLAAGPETDDDEEVGEPDSDTETMDQVRELLFGDIQRQHARIIAALEDRLKESDERINARLDKIEQQIAELARTSAETHGGALEELAAGIAELGAHVDKARRR